MEYKVFQYVPMSMSRALTRVIPRVLNIGCVPILDIEDSVQDTLNPENTPALKKAARESVPALASQAFDQMPKRVYLRINALRSGEFQKDVALLDELVDLGFQVGAFLPKVESLNDLIEIRDALGFDPRYLKAIPIIETVNGVRNLSEILDHRSGLDIEYVHYGHFDYSLDAECWPFYDQTSSEFWKIVDDLIFKVESAGTRYMHTPFGLLYNFGLFEQVIRTVAERCKHGFGITALTSDQSQHGTGIELGKTILPVAQQDVDKLSLAEKIVSEFEGNLRSKRSFAMNPDNGEFITPHHYKMAKLYISRYSNGKH